MRNSGFHFMMCLITFVPLSAQNMFFSCFVCLSSKAWMVVSFSVASKTEETRRSQREVRSAHTQAAIITNVLHRRLKSNVNLNPLKGRKKKVSKIPTVINQYFFFFFFLKTVGNKWPEDLLAKATTKVFTISLKDLFSLCFRGLWHYEEHRRGYRVPACCQHCAQRCQGLHCSFTSLHWCTARSMVVEIRSTCNVCSVLISFIFPAAWELVVFLKEAKCPAQTHRFWLR